MESSGHMTPTPDTIEGKLTELVMGKMTQLMGKPDCKDSRLQYNRIYETVLEGFNSTKNHESRFITNQIGCLIKEKYPNTHFTVLAVIEQCVRYAIKVTYYSGDKTSDKIIADAINRQLN